MMAREIAAPRVGLRFRKEYGPLSVEAVVVQVTERGAVIKLLPGTERLDGWREAITAPDGTELVCRDEVNAGHDFIGRAHFGAYFGAP